MGFLLKKFGSETQPIWVCVQFGTNQLLAGPCLPALDGVTFTGTNQPFFLGKAACPRPGGPWGSGGGVGFPLRPSNGQVLGNFSVPDAAEGEDTRENLLKIPGIFFGDNAKDCHVLHALFPRHTEGKIPGPKTKSNLGCKNTLHFTFIFYYTCFYYTCF